jgi:hypothetical protein
LHTTYQRRGISTGIQHPKVARKLTFQHFAIGHTQDCNACSILPGWQGPGDGEDKDKDILHSDEMDIRSSESMVMGSESEKTLLALTNASVKYYSPLPEKPLMCPCTVFLTYWFDFLSRQPPSTWKHWHLLDCGA